MTPLDNVNIRRLANNIKQSISESVTITDEGGATYFPERTIEDWRQHFTKMCEYYIECNAINRYLITDVTVDEDGSPTADIYVMPTKNEEYIRFSLDVTKESVTFSDILLTYSKKDTIY